MWEQFAVTFVRPYLGDLRSRDLLYYTYVPLKLIRLSAKVCGRFAERWTEGSQKVYKQLETSVSGRFAGVLFVY